MNKRTVAQLKARLEETGGRKQKQIATEFGVSRSLVSDIWTNRAHTDVPWTIKSGPVDRTRKGGQFTSTQHDPTDERVIQLEAECLHLKDELNVERRRAKANAKTQGLFKAMVDVLQDTVKPIKPPKSVYAPKAGRKIEEHCVMHLSDGHHDQIVTPEECGGLEKYDFQISCARAERYVDTVLKWTQETLSPQFHFPVLNVLAYGDHTSGEIHGHTNRSYYRNQFKNCLAIGQLHAMMYRELSAYFGQVNVVYVPGNHGRRSIKKDYHGAQDNWDYMVAEIARLHCADMPNIAFLIPNAFSVNLDINGVGFNVSHGDDVSGSLGIPYYGLQRRQRNMAAIAHAQSGPRVRYYCCGHFHKPGTLGDADGELLVNGPWVATDSYAYNRFSGYTEPTQWLHGVNPKHGITWRLPVNLRRPDDETPKRYLVQV